MVRMFLLYTTRILAWLGVVVALVWWGWMRPVLRGNFAFNWPQYSATGAWEFKEKALKMGRWTHDDGEWVGRWGDRDWMERLVREMEGGGKMEGCFNFHKESALALMTNQSPPETLGPGLTFEQWWLDWWRDNQHLRQEEWIRDGFAQQGIVVSFPASADDWPKLLKAMGAIAGPEEHGRPPELYSSTLRYNAFRWLRDSGFDPVAFALDSPSASESGEVRDGLRKYQEMIKLWVDLPAPGRLPLSKFDDSSAYMLARTPPLGQPAIHQQVEVGVTVGFSISLLILLFTPRIPIPGLRRRQ